MNPEVIELNDDEKVPESSSSVEPAIATAASSASPPKEHKKRQLTFDDFLHIRHVDTAVGTSGHAVGLRRSTRTPQPRSTIYMEEEEPTVKRKKLVKIKSKAPVQPKSKTEKDKGNYTIGSGNKLTKTVDDTQNFDVDELLASNTNWTPNAPLPSTDFEDHKTVLPKLENLNMKPLPYAGDIIKLMSFINKFHIFFSADLLNLSFQDFEIGLDLYPSTVQDMKEQQESLFYQDYIPVKTLIGCQDKMNLLLLTLLKLTLNTTKTTKSRAYQPQATLSQLKAKETFVKMIRQLRVNAFEWGYPAEWRTQDCEDEDFVKPQSKLFESDDMGPAVDENNPEVLTSNIYAWYRRAPLPFESDPLQTPELNKKGILALEPHDRLIFLRTLSNWCSCNSTKIHNEIHYLTHLKDLTFGVQTQHAPKYLMDGFEETVEQFTKLCAIVQNRYERRRKRNYVKKQSSDGKKEDLVGKLNTLKEIKNTLRDLTKEEKNSNIVKNYANWSGVFDGEFADNPLSDPFEDDIYKLRQQEFFVGRIPHIGDYYLPRLHSYSEDQLEFSTYNGPIPLQILFDRFSKEEIDAYTLFENYGQTLSAQFKLVFHDTPSIINDIQQGTSTAGKVYWYEVCHDSESLKEFLKYLDDKIGINGEQIVENDGTESIGGEEEDMNQLAYLNELESESVEDLMIEEDDGKEVSYFEEDDAINKEIIDRIGKILKHMEDKEEVTSEVGTLTWEDMNNIVIEEITYDDAWNFVYSIKTVICNEEVELSILQRCIELTGKLLLNINDDKMISFIVNNILLYHIKPNKKYNNVIKVGNLKQSIDNGITLRLTLYSIIQSYYNKIEYRSSCNIIFNIIKYGLKDTEYKIQCITLQILNKILTKNYDTIKGIDKNWYNEIILTNINNRINKFEIIIDSIKSKIDSNDLNHNELTELHNFNKIVNELDELMVNFPYIM